MTQTNKTEPRIKYETMVAEDTVTHIQVSSRSNTLLGRMMDPRYVSNFIHPKYGAFATLSGFWNYISYEEPEEGFRTATGHTLKQVKNYCDEHNTPVKREDFKKLITEAVFFKVMGNPRIIEQLINCDLPFRKYYYIEERDVFLDRTEEDRWLIDIYNDIRKVVKGDMSIVKYFKQ